VRYKTIKGKRYAYEQTSVRKGKKVKTISKYLGAVAAAPFVAAAPVQVKVTEGRGSKGHKSTDKRAKKHPEMSDRERFEKSMQNQREHFRREAAKTAAKNEAKPQAQPDPKVMDAIREFNEPRHKKKSRRFVPAAHSLPGILCQRPTCTAVTLFAAIRNECLGEGESFEATGCDCATSL
jgi:hypothetical protein